MVSNPFPGIFIAFEGIDGGGKSTQFIRAKNFLAACGTNAVFVKEPTSPEIYDMLYGRQNGHPSPSKRKTRYQ